ncbi:MAG: uroporphyrinogen-III C-methyltransferase [Gammaproteobacteria bacterium]|nr:uroporphyrinogen-III C-methyltransferase [Gammaproteobacteria bacterium]
MEFLPAFLDIANRQCLIVGGGVTALRKARLLLRASARLSVVSHQIDPELETLLKQGAHQFRLGEFTATDLQDAVLVIAATDDEALNRRVSKLAQARNIPVNVVDQPALCSMIFPAIVDRSPLVVAISSSGTSPVLVRSIKQQLEALLPQGSSQLATLLGSFRQQVKARLPDFSKRVRFWENVMDSEVVELAYTGNMEEARRQLESQLADPENMQTGGEVYLVGAGPGDPDLLTLKALRLMHKADVVLYDRLVSEEILQKVRPDAKKIHVGKQRSRHSVPQETINDMLVRLATAGSRVLRLKGGDPFIFGRGGEEMESLIDHGIPFQVVPGITAASGCASYAGIPLTHRDYSQSVQFLTGHFNDKTEEPDWSLLTRGNQTLVFYMGLLNLAAICKNLVDHGMSIDMPAALIQQGTTKNHKVVVGTLGALAGQVSAAGLRAPTLLIIGNVVKLRQQLDWFKRGATD